MKNTLTLILAATLIGSGCTHTTKITKRPELASQAALPERGVSLGFTPIVDDALLEAAVDRIQADPSVAWVDENFKFGGAAAPAYVCTLERTNRFKASGQNFLITFPGFIVFTHAWLGYKYTAELETTSTLLNSNAVVISQTTISSPFEFRHCSFARGASAGICGWLLPGYGAAAIIPGAMFASSYDKRATGEFQEKAQSAFAQHVGTEVLNQIARAHADRPETTSLLRLPPFPLDDDLDAEDDYTEAHFAVYTLRTDEAATSEPEFQMQALSPSARQTLDAMSRTATMPADRDLEALLLELGISSGELFGRTAEIRISTQAGESRIDLSRADDQPGAVL